MGSSSISLVATLGPSSLHLADKLEEAGATAFRLNASHMQPAELASAVASARGQSPLPITVDLQGAKMRIGGFDERSLRQGQVVRFALAPTDLATVPLPHRELFRAVQPGDTLSFDDDRIRMQVVRVGDGELDARCAAGGVLRPRKGVNVLDHPIALGELSERDGQHIDAVRGQDRMDFAFSFMLDGREASWVRQRAPGARVIGKVERREAVAAIESIVVGCDEVWICRGDLGAQLGPASLSRWVSDYRPSGGSTPVLMAGQVLEHLTRHADPTRSEVCHLFDLLRRGYAGIVLSDETAIGDDPVRAVRAARELITQMRG